MILGVIVPMESESNKVYQNLTHKFCRIDSKIWSKCMDIGVVVNSPIKYQLLQKLETLWKNLFITGNLFLDEDVQQSIIEGGGAIIAPSESIHKVNTLNMSESSLLELHAGNYELNIIQGVTSGLDLDNKWMADTINEVSVDEVEVISMSIEDSIKNAMKELGIEPDNVVSPDPPKTEEKTDEVSLEELPDPSPEPTPIEQPEIVPETISLPEVVNSPSDEETPQIEQNLDIYLKIKDGTMALFIPEGIRLPAEVIEGVKYSTLVFRAPDLGNTQLQALSINSQIKVKAAEKPVVSHISGDSSLEELVKKKSSLDFQIKTARNEGNAELVKQLRKQRRHVREQINLWGQQS